MTTPTFTPMGYAQDTTINAASPLAGTIPQGASRAVVYVTAQACRWRDDGTNPTSTVGIPLAVNTELVYEGDLTKFRIIEQAGGAVLNVAFYG